MCKGAKVGRTPSSARDPLVALLQPLSTFERDGTLGSLELLGDSHDLCHRGEAHADLAPAVFAQVAHAVAARRLGERGGVFIRHDAGAQLVVELHHLEDAHAAGIAGSAAVFATGAAPGVQALAFGPNSGARRGLAVRAD